MHTFHCAESTPVNEKQSLCGPLLVTLGCTDERCRRGESVAAQYEGTESEEDAGSHDVECPKKEARPTFSNKSRARHLSRVQRRER